MGIPWGNIQWDGTAHIYISQETVAMSKQLHYIRANLRFYTFYLLPFKVFLLSFFLYILVSIRFSLNLNFHKFNNFN